MTTVELRRPAPQPLEGEPHVIGVHHATWDEKQPHARPLTASNRGTILPTVKETLGELKRLGKTGSPAAPEFVGLEFDDDVKPGETLADAKKRKDWRFASALVARGRKAGVHFVPLLSTEIDRAIREFGQWAEDAHLDGRSLGFGRDQRLSDNPAVRAMQLAYVDRYRDVATAGHAIKLDNAVNVLESLRLRERSKTEGITHFIAGGFHATDLQRLHNAPATLLSANQWTSRQVPDYRPGAPSGAKRTVSFFQEADERIAHYRELKPFVDELPTLAQRALDDARAAKPRSALGKTARKATLNAAATLLLGASYALNGRNGKGKPGAKPEEE